MVVSHIKQILLEIHEKVKIYKLIVLDINVYYSKLKNQTKIKQDAEIWRFSNKFNFINIYVSL